MFSFNLVRWLKNLFRSRVKTIVKKPRFRLCFEELETRLAPATYNWIGGAAGNWGTAANWNIGAINPTQPIDLVFPTAGTTATNNIAGLNINSITYSANNVTLTGSSFTLGNPATVGSGFISVGAGFNNENISAGMNIQFAGAGGNAQNITVNSASTLTISSQLSGTTGSQLTKEGTGTLILSGNDSGFVGPFTVDHDAGIVEITNSQALGGVTTSTVESLTLHNAVSAPPASATRFTLQFGPGAPVLGANLTNTIIYTGNTSTDAANVQAQLNLLTAVNTGGNSVQVYATITGANETFFITFVGPTFTGANVAQQVTGAVTLNAGNFFAPVTTAGGTASPYVVTVGNNSQLQLSGGINVANTLNLFGNGAANNGALFNLAGANTWSGSVVLESSTLNNSDIGVFAGALTISGVISDTGSGVSLTKMGTGTLFLSNANIYRGATYIENGILTVQNPLALGAVPSAGTYTQHDAVNGHQGSLQLQYGLNGDILTGTPTVNNLATTSGLTVGMAVFGFGIPAGATILSINSSTSVTLSANATQFQTVALTFLPTGRTTNGSAIITGLASTTTFTPGMSVIGNGIPAGATILSINSPTSVTLNTNATATAVGVVLTFLANPQYYILGDPTRAYDPATNPYVGFVVPNYSLFLLGGGFLGTFTLDNNAGDNAWSGPVVLLPDASQGANPSININVQSLNLFNRVQTQLIITGVISDGTLPAGVNPVTVNKTSLGQGNLILEPTIHTASVDLGSTYSLVSFPDGYVSLTQSGGTGTANTYLGSTNVGFVAGGTLTLVDSQALGPNSKTAMNSVGQGSSLNLISNVGHIDSVTGTTNRLVVDSPMTLNGPGFNINGQDIGTIHSASGINTYGVNVAYNALHPANPDVITVSIFTGTIGVDPEPVATANNNYFTNDYSLTINGGINGANTLTKLGAGHLILPNANLDFSSTWDIKSGWVTIENPEALGKNLNVIQQLQPTDTVESGAALMFKPFAAGTSFTFAHNLILQGLGITHPFYAINQKGALENIGGINSTTSDIQLIGQTGIGVEQVDPLVPSDLTLTGENSERAPAANFALATVRASGGVAQYTQLIDTGALAGTLSLAYTGASGADNFRVYSGPIGTPGSTLLTTSTPAAGAGIITVPFVGGGVITGATPVGVPIDITSANHGLTTGQKVTISGVLGNTAANGTFTVTVTGPNTFTLAGSIGNGTYTPGTGTWALVGAGTNLQVVVNGGVFNPANTWTYTATVTPTLATFLGGIVKLGSQRLNIQGAGLFNGGVDIQQGVVRTLSNLALGSVNGLIGTTVESGAALELGSTTGISTATTGGVVAGASIWNNHLTLNGTGNSTFGDAPLTVLAKDNEWHGPITLGATINIAFQGVLANQPVPTMTANYRDAAGLPTLTGPFSTTTPVPTPGITPTVDLVTTTAGVESLNFTGMALTSTFKLRFNGVSTGAIAYTGTAADAIAIQTNLNILSTVLNIGSVSVTQTVPDPGTGSSTFLLNFRSNLAGLITAQVTGPGAATVAANGLNAVQTLTFGGTQTDLGTGYFTLSGINAGVAFTTGHIIWSANQNTLVANIQAALTPVFGLHNFNVSLASPTIDTYPNARLVVTGTIDDVAGSSVTTPNPLIHDYEFQNTLTDSLGGLPLIATGGSVNATNFTWNAVAGANQGLTLQAGQLPALNNYAVEMVFHFNSQPSPLNPIYSRILDFKNRTSDNGLYDTTLGAGTGSVQPYPGPQSPTADFTAGTDVNIIITRDVTGQVICYVNGVQRLNFIDAAGDFISTGTLNFFIDDLFVPNEVNAGAVSKIRVYSRVLTPAEVTTVVGGGTLGGTTITAGSGMPADLNIAGGGELVLAGTNTFRGTTYVNQGTLTIQNGQALGSTGVAGTQQIALTGASAIGASPTRFQLYFDPIATNPPVVGVNQTGLITYTGSDLDATNIQNALNALTTINAGGAAQVIQTGPGQFLVTFTGALTGTTTPLTAKLASGPGTIVAGPDGGTVVANNAQLQMEGGISVGGEPLIVQGAGSNVESTVQTFTVGTTVSPPNSTTGSYSLNFNGGSTISLPFNADATQVQTALQNAINVTNPGGTVAVNQTAFNSGTNETQKFNFPAGYNGQYQLYFDPSGAAPLLNVNLTPAIAFAGNPFVDVSRIVAALNLLPTITGVAVGGTVSAGAVGSSPNEFVNISFSGGLGNQPLPLVVVSYPGAHNGIIVPSHNPTGTGASRTFSVVFQGAFNGQLEPLMTVTRTTQNVPIRGALNSATTASFPIGTSYYVVTAITPAGESVVSNEQPVVTIAADVTKSVILSWTSVAGATGYKIYRSTTSSNYTNALLTTIVSGATVTFTDTGAAVSAGTPGTAAVSNPAYGIQGGTANATPLQYFSVGPNPITNAQVFNGAGGFPAQLTAGRVTGVDVFNGAPGVMVISTAGGGFWKTTDSGKHWTQLFDAVNNVPTFAGAVAIAQSNPSNVYYATGEGNNSGDSYYGSGVYLNGALLTSSIGVANPLAGLAVNKIIVDPNNPFQIWVATSDQAVNGINNVAGSVGIWRYDGVNWLRMTVPVGFPSQNVSYSDIAYDGTKLYAAVDGFGVLVCTNPTAPVPAAFTDTLLSTFIPPPGWVTPVPLVPPQWTIGNIKLATEGVGNRVYATVGNSFGVAGPPGSQNLLGIMETTDGGTTWTVIYSTAARNLSAADVVNDPTPFQATPILVMPDYLNSQGDYDSAIVDRGVVLTGAGFDRYLFVAGVDQGSGTNFIMMLPEIVPPSIAVPTWLPAIDLSQDSSGSGFGPHTDVHSLRLDSNGNLLAATDGGLWRGTVVYNGAASTITWANLNGDLGITELLSVSPQPDTTGTILGGAQDNGTFLYTGSQGWGQVFAGDGQVVRYVPTNPSVAYQITNGNLYQSIDGGATFTAVLDQFGVQVPASDLAVDPNNPLRIVISGGIKESLAAGAPGSFVTLPGAVNSALVALANKQGTYQADPAFVNVPARAANYNDSGTIYTANQDPVGFGLPDLRVTKDDGVTLSGNRAPTALMANGTNIQSLTVDPSNRDTVYVTTNGFVNANGIAGAFVPANMGKQHVFKSTNAGQTWTDISAGLPDLPTWSLVVDPRSNDLYAGTDMGVYKLAGSVGTWVKFGAGLPNVQVTDLQLDTNNNILTVASYGRGVWQFYLDNTTQANAGAFRALGGDNTWTGTITLAGPTTISAAGSQNLQSGVSGASLTLGGTISDSTNTVTNTLTKIGGGDVVLRGTNTYAGITLVQQGNLGVQNASGLGSSGTTVATGQGTQMLVFTSPVAGFTQYNLSYLTFPTAVTYTGVSGTGVGSDALAIQTALNTLLAAHAAGNTVTVTPDSTDTIFTVTFVGPLAGAIQPLLTATVTNGLGTSFSLLAGATDVYSGAALELGSNLNLEPITLNGDGVQPPYNGHNTGALINVSNANTYTGTITLNTNSTIGVTAGQLTIASANANGIVDGGTPSSLTKEGSGTLVLASADSYRGGTNVAKGILDIQNSNALGAAANTVVTEGAQLRLEQSRTNQPTQNALSLVNSLGVIPSGTTYYYVVTAMVGGVESIISNERSTTTVAANQEIVVSWNQVTGATSYRIYRSSTSSLYANSLLTTVLAGALPPVYTFTDRGTPTSAGTPSAINVTNQTLFLSGSGITNDGALRNVAGENIWAGNIVLASVQNFSPASTPVGVVGIFVDSTDVLTNTNSALTIAGNISEGPPPQPAGLPVPGTSASGLADLGPGTLVLAGNNTYTGSTYVGYTFGVANTNGATAPTVPGGVIDVQSSNALGLNTGNEIQRVSTYDPPGTIPADTFRLTFNGQTTRALTYGLPGSLAAGPTGVTAVAAAGAGLAVNTYFYEVTAIVAGVESTPSAEVSVPIAGLNRSVNLAWNIVAGATGYKVYRTTVSGNYTSPSLIAPGPVGAVLVYHDVSAATVVGAPPETVEHALNGLASIGANGVSVTSSMVTTGLNEVQTLAFTNPASPAFQPLQPTVVVANGGAFAAGSYFYTITAIGPFGESTQSLQQATGPVGANQQVTVSWTPVAGATGYKLYRSTTSGVFTSPALATTITGGAVSSYLDTGAAVTAGTPPLQTQYNLAFNVTLGGDTTTGSPTVNGLASNAQLVAGMTVTGAGIPANTTILSVSGVNTTTITLSNNATATAVSARLTFGTSTPTLNYTGVGGTGAGSDALAIQTALRALTTIGAGNVTVTPDATDTVFTITFNGALTDVAQALIVPKVTQSNAVANVAELTPGDGGPAYVYTVTFNGSAFNGAAQPLLTVPAIASAISVGVSEVATGGIGTLVYNGAALQLDGDPTHAGNGVNISFNAPTGNTLALNGTGTATSGGALVNVSGNNSWQGNIILQTNSTIAAAATTQLTLTGAIQDPALTAANPVPLTAPASLTKAGTGTVVLAPIPQTIVLNDRPVQNGPTLTPGGALVAGTPVFYVITAVDGSANESLVSNEQTVTPAAGNQTANLSWNAVSGASFYRVYRSTSAGNYANALLAIIPAGTLTYIDNGVLPVVAGTPPASRNFTLTFTNAAGTGTTGPIAYNGLVGAGGTDANIRAALITLLAAAPFSYPASDVNVFALDANNFSATFTGAANSGLLPLTGVFTNSGTGVVSVVTGNTFTGDVYDNAGILNIQSARALGVSTSAVEQVAVSGSSGSFSLTFNSQTTVALQYGATAAQVQTALNNLSSINAGGGSVAVTQTGNTYFVYFNGLGLAHLYQNPLTYTIVTPGITSITITHPLAGGATNVDVANGATLQTQSNTVPLAFSEASGKYLTLAGQGFNGSGALENVLGNNAWSATPITLGSTVALGADDGSTLALNQAITDNVFTPTIQFNNTFAAGDTYSLSYGGAVTGVLTYLGVTGTGPGSDGARIQAALQSLSSIIPLGGTVNVTSPLGGHNYNVTFNNTLYGTFAPVIGSIPITSANGAFVPAIAPATSDIYGVNKVGTGAVQYNVGNTYTGPTTVVNGTLELNNTTGSGFAVPGFLQVGVPTVVNQVQTLTLPAYTSGVSQFTLTYGVTTASITYYSNPTYEAVAIQQALNAVLGANFVKVTATSATVFTVTMVGLGSTDPVVQITGAPVAPAVLAISPAIITTHGSASAVPLTTGTPLSTGAPVALLQASTVPLSGQINPASSVLVNNDGLLDINNVTQTIAALTVTGGVTTTGPMNGNLTVGSLTINDGTLIEPGAGIVTVNGAVNMTGGTINLLGATSQLVLGAGSSVTATSDPTAGANTGAARIIGAGKVVEGATTRNFTVNHGLLATVDTDLFDSAVIDGGAGVGLNKLGLGRMEIAADETYPGTTTINQGDVQLDGAGSTQVITLVGASAGTTKITLSFNGLSAPAFTYQGPTAPGADAASIQSALAALGIPPASIVSVTPDVTDTVFTLVFTTLLAPIMPAITSDPGTGNAYLTLPNNIANVVLAGGSLSGTGAAGGIPAAGTGTVNPGVNTATPKPGILNVNGNVVWGASNTFFVDLANASGNHPDPIAGSDYDQLSVNGSVTLGNAMLSAGVSGNVQLNDNFTILQATGGIDLSAGGFMGDVGGVIGPVVDHVFLNGEKFLVQYTANTVVLTHVLENLTAFTMTSSQNASAYGQQVTFTISATPEAGASFATGTPQFNLTLTPIGPSSLSTYTTSVAVPLSGVVAYTPPAAFLTQSGTTSFTVDVTFTDPNIFNAYPPATPFPADITQVVNQNTVILAVSSNPVQSATAPVYGQTVTINAAASPGTPLIAGAQNPTGNVEFIVDPSGLNQVTDVGITAATGIASLPILPGSPPLLAAGDHTISVQYLGDANYAVNASQNYDLMIQKDASIVTFTSPSNTAPLGQNATISVQVTPNLSGSTGHPTGTVNFYDGPPAPGNMPLNGVGTPVSVSPAGVASFTTNSLSLGGHTIYAVYSGDNNYTAPVSIPTAAFTVTQGITSTSFVSQTPSSPNYGDQVTFVMRAVENPVISPIYNTLTGNITLLADVASLGLITNVTGNGVVPVVITTGSTTGLVDGQQVTVFGVLGNDAANGTFAITVLSLTQFSLTGPTGNGAYTSGGAWAVLGATGANLGFNAINSANGQASVLTPPVPSALSQGSHVMKAVFNSTNPNFAGSIATLSPFVVNAAGTSVTSFTANPASGDVYGNTVVLTATVSTNVGTLPQGAGSTVSFYDGATLLGAGNLMPGNTASYTTTPLQLIGGSHTTITAVYTDASNTYATSNRTLPTYVVARAPTSVTTPTALPASGYVYGTAGGVTFSARATSSVSALPVGAGSIISFYNGSVSVGNLLGSGTINGTGNASYTTTASQLSASSHSIIAVYSDGFDTNFATSPPATPLTYVVAQASTTVTIPTASPANPNDVFGNTVLLSATANSTAGLTLPTGAGSVINFYNGTAIPANLLGSGAINGSGAASYTTTASQLIAGTHSITAVYSDTFDGNFSNSPGAVLNPYVVQKANTSVALSTSAPVAAAVGQSVTFTATVTSPTSAVNSTIAPGSTVTFKDGITTIGTIAVNASGVAILMTSFAATGSHTITAQYNIAPSVSPNFNASVINAGSTVVQTVRTASTVSPVAPIANAVYGATLNFMVTVTPAAARGSVSVFDPVSGFTFGPFAIPAGGGSFTAAISTLTVGTHNLVFNYSGDATYAPSSFAFTNPNQLVLANTTTAVTSSLPAGSNYGQPVTFTATVTAGGAANPLGVGTVTFKDTTTNTVLGTVNLGVGSNQAMYTTTSAQVLSVASHTITATYNGTATTYAACTFAPGSSGSVVQVVSRAVTTTQITQSSITNGFYGQAVTFTAVVTAGSGGTPTTTGATVAFTDTTTGAALGNGTLVSTTATSATYTLAVGAMTLNAQSHSITATYNKPAVSNFASSAPSPTFTQMVQQATTNTVLTSSQTYWAIGQPVTFTAAVKATSAGTPGVPVGSVDFNVDGVVTNRPLNASGVAMTLPVTFTGPPPTPNNHSVTATYRPDLPAVAVQNFATSSAPTQTQNVRKVTTLTLTSSAPASVVYGTSITYTATLSTTATGGPPTTAVIFIIDGVNYTGTLYSTSATSVVYKFTTTTLAVGTHSVTAHYNGDANFNPADPAAALTQTITPKLTRLTG